MCAAISERGPGSHCLVSLSSFSTSLSATVSFSHIPTSSSYFISTSQNENYGFANVGQSRKRSAKPPEIILYQTQSIVFIFYFCLCSQFLAHFFCYCSKNRLSKSCNVTDTLHTPFLICYLPQHLLTDTILHVYLWLLLIFGPLI